MNGRITKIKAKKGEYTFWWEIFQKETKNWDKFTLVCKDPPKEELKERLQVMANHVVEICEFEQSATKKIAVSGITVSYTQENRYLVITALKDLNYSQAPLVINTPARPELPNGECTEEFCMSKVLRNDLMALENEAWLYINGDRAQQSLFNENQEGKEDKPEPEPPKPEKGKSQQAA